MSEILSRIILAASFAIRWSKSRYNPKNPAQKWGALTVLTLCC